MGNEAAAVLLAEPSILKDYAVEITNVMLAQSADGVFSDLFPLHKMNSKI